LPFENDNWQVLKDAVLRGNIDSIPGLPVRAMDALIRGLAKKAEERFGSCGEFVAALGGKTKLTIKSSAIRSADSTKGRRKKSGGWGWLAVLAVAGGLGAGAWWGLGGPGGTPQESEEIQRRIAEMERRLAEEREATEKTRRELEEWLARLKQQHQQETEEQGPANEDHPVPAPSLGVGRQAGQERVIVLSGGAEMAMVWCPEGEFMMGSPANEEGRNGDEGQHQVKLTKGFWMAKTEVTQGQWESVMGDNPSNHKGNDLPVECVSWNECQEFCQKAGLALPTEAEWEYACRAGSTGPYAGSGRLDDMGWYKGNSGNETHPVGRKQPNAWGLHDMHGNVWEWCADWYDSGYYAKSPEKDPKGGGSGGDRVLRGGSYWYDPRGCRSADRGWYNPALRSRSRGFRPVLRQD
jgi:formylglycine-generating enzyme required for sulfatase activity